MPHIPPKVHLYWGSADKHMSWLRYLTIVSLKKQNPTHQIILHIPKKPSIGGITWNSPECRDIVRGANFYDQALAEASSVVEHDFSWLPNADNLHEVHRSDILRWKLLSTEGGFWSDLDILYFNPLRKIQFSNRINRVNLKAGVHIYPKLKAHAIGLLFAAPENPFFSWVFEKSIATNAEGYQSLGSELINRTFPTVESIQHKFRDMPVGHIEQSSVYSIPPYSIQSLYSRSGNKRLPELGIGIHWYGGNPLSSQYESKVTSNNYLDNTYMSKVIEAVLR